jgi:hypothetical protein
VSLVSTNWRCERRECIVTPQPRTRSELESEKPVGYSVDFGDEQHKSTVSEVSRQKAMRSSNLSPGIRTHAGHPTRSPGSDVVGE